MKYDFAAIEKKWQDKWEEVKPYAAVTGSPKPKFYGLIEFPYPSAAGLHVGHPRPFTAIDIVSRKKRMDTLTVTASTKQAATATAQRWKEIRLGCGTNRGLLRTCAMTASTTSILSG